MHFIVSLFGPAAAWFVNVCKKIENINYDGTPSIEMVRFRHVRVYILGRTFLIIYFSFHPCIEHKTSERDT